MLETLGLYAYAYLVGAVPTAYLIWFCAGSVGLTVLKRLMSNWQPLPVDLPKGQVLLNRLLRDRDVARRADWVGRIPG